MDMASQVTVSAKYQVVIPEDVRRSLPIQPGQKMVVLVKHGIISLVPLVPIEELRGMAADLDLSGYREEEEEDRSCRP
jgi:AbrB family looped-hinge helix DNA binding protein